MGIGEVSQGMRRAVFLDRDGVLNQIVLRNGKPYPPGSAEEIRILPGVPEALQSLRENGFLLYVVTNQPDVARGRQSVAEVERIHAFLAQNLPLDGFYVCYHDDNDQCSCRKPRPGLVLAAAREHSIDLQSSYMVGDRWRDIEAGHRAGCRTAWIDYAYNEPAPKVLPDVRAGSLDEATTWILNRE